MLYCYENIIITKILLAIATAHSLLSLLSVTNYFAFVFTSAPRRIKELNLYSMFVNHIYTKQ